MGMLRGIAVSSGIARGTAIVLACADRAAGTLRRIEASQVEAEIARFEAALDKTERDLLALKRSVQERIGSRESDIFTAQALVLRDPSIKQKVGAVVRDLPANSDLEAAFARIREHLKPGGLLIFDHWYGPAVLTDRPAPRIKTFENDEVKIIRIAMPTLLVNDNLVDVRYDLTIVEKLSARCSQVVENHRMRYLFWPEIESLLSRHGLNQVEFREWLSDRAPDQSSWNTFVAATAQPEAL